MTEWWLEWEVTIPFDKGELVREEVQRLGLDDMIDCCMPAISVGVNLKRADYFLVSVTAIQPLASNEYDDLLEMLLFIAENCIQGTIHDDQFVDVTYSHDREAVLLTNGSIYTLNSYDVSVNWEDQTIQYGLALDTWGPSDKPSIKVKGLLHGEDRASKETKEKNEVQGELFPV